LSVIEKQGARSTRDFEAIASNAVVSNLVTSGLLECSEAEQAVTVAQEAQGLLSWLEWARRGKRIIHVNDTLTHAFEHSDCGEMTLEEVLPSQVVVCYFHFNGISNDYAGVPGGGPLEGAYLICYPQESLRVVLCSRRPEGGGALEQWQERYDLRIDRAFFHLSADDAIDRAIEEDLSGLEHAKQQMLEAHRSSTAGADVLIARVAEGQPAYRKAIRLVLNVMAYIKYYDSGELPSRWPMDAPTKLVTQAQQGAALAKARAESKLWNLGHSKICFLGGDFLIPGVLRGQKVATHWRRGHWRRQAHGAGFQLRKLKWIYPTLVSGDTAMRLGGE
jgi:hypothetical protein